MKNIVILGHGVGVKLIIDSLLNSNLDYRVNAIITHPYQDHLPDLQLVEKRKDLYGEYAYNVFNAKQDYNIDVVEAVNVNDTDVVAKIKEYNPAYLISMGCRNIIKKEFLNEFEGRVLNIHTTPLPMYRGAANDSWMILNGEWGKQKYGCMHYIDAGIDTGDIIAKGYYTIPVKSYPVDVYKVRMDAIKQITVDGLTNLDTKGFVAEKQNVNAATTFPRLFTPVDGKIDFEKFSGDELVRFIYAFGYPFVGAHCFLEDKKINILDAEFITGEKFHSFSHGLIVGKDENNCYKISVKGGVLKVLKVEIDGQEIPQNKVFKLGRFLK